MLVMIKSAPETADAKRALSLAGDLGADIVLIQSAVYLGAQGRMNGFQGAVYALDEDLLMRGIGPNTDISTVRRIDYDMLVDLLVKVDGVCGAF